MAAERRACKDRLLKMMLDGTDMLTWQMCNTRYVQSPFFWFKEFFLRLLPPLTKGPSTRFRELKVAEVPGPGTVSLSLYTVSYFLMSSYGTWMTSGLTL